MSDTYIPILDGVLDPESVFINNWKQPSKGVSNKRAIVLWTLLLCSFSPSEHIFVDLPSIRRWKSTGKVRRGFINFKRRIHVEIMTSIRRGNFYVGSTFKIDEILMSSPRGFFYVISTLNQRNYYTRCFHSTMS